MATKLVCDQGTCVDDGIVTATLVSPTDNRTYAIDLCKKHSDALLKNARLAASTPIQRRTAKNSGPSVNLAAVREWARSQGHKVSDRGRIPAEIVEAAQKAGVI